MMLKNISRKKIFSLTGNILFWGLLILLLLHPPAKAWVLRQVMWTGIFNAKIENDNNSTSNVADISALQLRDAEGRLISPAELQGKVVFVNFWATWCPPCIAEMPDLEKLYKDFKNDERFFFAFVSEDDQISTATQYLTKKQLSIPLYSLAAPASSNIYSGTLPTTVVFDKSGKLAFRHEGLASYYTGDFIKQLRELGK